MYQSRMETERARECFRRLDSCRGADPSDRVDRFGLVFVFAWIPYQDERLHVGKRESGAKNPTDHEEMVRARDLSVVQISDQPTP